jgi:hypothetical protein
MQAFEGVAVPVAVERASRRRICVNISGKIRYNAR